MRRAFALLLLLAAGPAWAADPPDIVVLLADDLGYGDLGCYDHPRIPTPHLDNLRKAGAKFTDFYAGLPVCSPSRAALFTGRSPQRLGINDWIAENSGVHLKKAETTLPALLRRGGYRTALFGKWHLNSVMDGTEPTPGDHGFDHWFSTQNNALPTHQNPTNFLRNGSPAGPLTGNSSTLVVDEAVSFLRGVQPGQPVALFVCFHAPHEQVAVPENWATRFKDITDPTKREYFASIELMDSEIGRLLGALRGAGRLSKALVLFTSDNGPEGLKRYPKATHSHGSAGPLRGMKLSLFEGGLRVPLLVTWPGKVAANSTVIEPASFLDLLPTLCAAAGVVPPPDRPLDGTDITPLLEDRNFTRGKPLVWKYDAAKGGPWTHALRDGKWKLLADAKQEKFALYQLNRDLGEKRDVATTEPNKVRELAAKLKATLAERAAKAE